MVILLYFPYVIHIPYCQEEWSNIYEVFGYDNGDNNLSSSSAVATTYNKGFRLDWLLPIPANIPIELIG